MSKKSHPKPAKPAAKPTAAKRRSSRGITLAIGVFAAIGIVVLLNYVVYWQYRGMSPEARRWVRYDLTSTRRYSLSDQTRRVLGQLDSEHRLVTMLGGDTISDDREQRVRDLADEYARANKLIEVQHIDLDTQADRRAELLGELDAMFAEDTADIRETLSVGLALLDKYSAVVDQIEAGVGPLNPDTLGLTLNYRDTLSNLKSRHRKLQQDANTIKRMRDEQLGQDWADRLASPGARSGSDTNGENLPDYVGLVQSLQAYFDQYVVALPFTAGSARLIAGAIDVQRNGPIDAQVRANQAQRMLGQLQEQSRTLELQAKRDRKGFENVLVPQRYQDARALLNDKPCVLLTTGDDARVLSADALFRGTAESEAEQGEADLFVGEEQLTGAFISLTLAPPPLVVFIRSNSKQRARSLFNKDQRLEGEYDHVINRLLSMDFEVAEWINPGDEKTMPTPLPGQKVVWVNMPYLSPSLLNPSTRENGHKDRVALFLAKRLAAGDSALLMLSHNPYTDPDRQRGIAADSLAVLADQFGIQPQLHHRVSRLVQEDEDAAKSRYGVDFIVSDWPDSVVAGQALDGIETYFRKPSPITLRDTKGVIHLPLVQLDQPAMLAQADTPDEKPDTFKPEIGSARDAVLIGAGAKRGATRLAVITDEAWAMDNRTTLAILPDGASGVGLADQPGARLAYPGNTDLFVNTVCWLAHEESLIAASPRTKDIRRIQPMSEQTLAAYRVALWGVMPGAIFVAGIVVWLLRRRA